MSRRVAGLGIGIAFGIGLSWSGMTSPNVIRGALLFEHSYLFLFFASAIFVATAGSWALRATGVKALFTGQPITWAQERPERRHIVGALLFGIGWGISDACPGPIATQIGQGIAWGVFPLVGVVVGVKLYLRRERVETEPATEAASPLKLQTASATAV
jgi:uncharacterized protein